MTKSVEHSIVSRPMCGIIAMADKNGQENVVPELCDMMSEIDSRGGDTTGIGVIGQQRIGNSLWSYTPYIVEGRASQVLGNVRNVLMGHVALGQTRYRTQGMNGLGAAQPFHNADVGLALVHNGNVETGPLREALNTPDKEYCSDSDMLCALMAKGLATHHDIEKVVRSMWSDIDGAHNVCFALQDGTIGAWKDEEEKHPLVIGRNGSKVAIASEDFAIRQVWGDQTDIQDIEPGCLVQVKPHEEPTVVRIADVMRSACPFELIYFMKRFSHFLDIQAAQARHRAGMELATLDLDFWKKLGIVPMVIPVPQSAKYVAQGYTDVQEEFGIFEVLSRDPAFGRTFIADESVRAEMAKQKYGFRFPDIIRGQHVLLVEDSVVRSTTLRSILDRIREHEPAGIHVRSAFPPVVAPCFDGINMSTVDELYYTNFRQMLLEGASQSDIEQEMARDLHIDSLRYLPASRLAAVLNVPERELCEGCWRGIYTRESRQKLFDLKIGEWTRNHAEGKK